MPIGEVIFGAIGELFGYIVVDLIIEGIGKLFRGVYYGIRKILTGKIRDIPELKRIEKRYLYKKIRLKSDFSERILKGTRGSFWSRWGLKAAFQKGTKLVGKTLKEARMESQLH